MLAIVAAVLAFLAVSCLVLLLVRGGRSRDVERRLDRLSQPVEDHGGVGTVLRRDSGTFPFLRRLTSGGWSLQARRDLAQAGVSLKVSEYLMIRLLIGGIAAVVVFVISAGATLGLLIAIVVGLTGFMFPAWWLTFRRSRRQAKINSQLAETLSLISNSLRSGFAFTQAVELAVRQIDPPMKEELSQFLHDTSLGSPTDEALQELAERTGSYDLEMMVSSILIQRTTGGNLSEVLDSVASTIRERERLQGEIRALTASQRFTGLVLSVYPIGLGLLLAALAPSVWKVLVTEEAGRILLGIAAVLQVMGIIIIRRILRLEV